MASGPKRRITHAFATVRVKIYRLGTWGDECPMTQVYSQAAAAAVGFLRNRTKVGELEIIGEPEVTAVITEEDA